ncbi:hypothetical protein [Asaia spathodeae]|uniref:Uncharacterized protein n=1 Tax=Asaia spathodeae TaxID=657016 RepID=A0ABX2P575_9PROT|nr:hypothetical protein [Asaia spathodeae]GBR12362.1 hypothetical protein AA105894_0503 [Asaia spathodeae NBRC 105894]
MAILRDRDIASLQATDRKTLYDTGIAPGSARDFARRLRLILPAGWFPAYRGDEVEDAPILQSLLTGFGAVLASIWSLTGFVRRQTRMGTTDDAFLEMAAADFFGPSGMVRLNLEKDTHFRRRMVGSLVAPLNTRAAVSEAVRRLSGAAPRIIEPGNVHDCGAWCQVGGYGASRTRYGAREGGQFFLEVYPKLPVEQRALHAAIKATKASGVIAWIRMQA